MAIKTGSSVQNLKLWPLKTLELHSEVFLLKFQNEVLLESKGMYQT